MAEIGIDQSKLPGVKEVCRDFAVLEDHTLAHSLQEQEIEHHLATNVQRNRLVQGDLQIAKQLQEEEDRRARDCVQERHKDIEQQDCEIAQEIQVKLVIEAEQLRRQEEDDEDIARVLQQKELQGEKKKKKRRKPLTEASQHGGYQESCYSGSRDRPSRSPPGQSSRSWSGDRLPPQSRDTRRAPPFVSEGLELEVLGSSSEERKAKDGQRHRREKQRDKKPGGHEKPWKEVEGEALEGGSGRSRDGRAASEEGPRRTSPLGREAGHERREGQKRRPRSRERLQTLVDWREEEAGRYRKCRERLSPSSEKSLRNPSSLAAEEEEEMRSRRPVSGSPCLGGHRPPPREERQSPQPFSHDRRPRDPDTASQRSPRRMAERGRVGEPPTSSSSSSSSRHGESRELDPRCSWQPGTKSRGTKEATFPKPRGGVVVQDLESFDAEIAWKLQEEELLANEADEKAAQVAQDEEIARLLMAEEKKKAAYKKAKEREKTSSEEKKKQDQTWKHNTSESGGPRSREDHDPHRGHRSDKPTRPPPPPTEELDHLVNLTSQQNSAYQVPKPEPPHKGYHYKP